MSNYTLGPWFEHDDLTIRDKKRVKIAKINAFVDIVNYKEPSVMAQEILANSRLIAAAPDLLKACETFVEWIRREDEGFYDSEHSRDPKTGLRYPEGSEEYRDAFWKWYDDNVDLCDLAKRQALIAIAKAKGEEK